MGFFLNWRVLSSNCRLAMNDAFHQIKWTCSRPLLRVIVTNISERGSIRGSRETFKDCYAIIPQVLQKFLLEGNASGTELVAGLFLETWFLFLIEAICFRETFWEYYADTSGISTQIPKGNAFEFILVIPTDISSGILSETPPEIRADIFMAILPPSLPEIPPVAFQMMLRGISS